MGRLYDKRRWHRVRARKLARNPECEGCEEQPSRQVDHITPLDKGGAPYDPANLMSLCIPCHTEKTGCDKIGRQWVMAKDRGCDEHGKPNRSVRFSTPRGGCITAASPPNTAAPRENELIPSGAR